MAITRGRFEAKLTATEVWEADIQGPGDGAPVTATVLANGAGGYISALVDDAETAFNAASADTWTISIGNGENGTGRVTIVADATPFSVTWTSTKLRNAFGFTAGIAGAVAAQTGASHAQGLWLPDKPKITPYGNLDDGWTEADTRATESPAGHVLTVGGHYKVATAFEFPAVSRRRARIAGEQVSGESFEQFWRDCIQGDLSERVLGDLVRYFWDAAAADFTDFRVAGDLLRQYRPELTVQGLTNDFRVVLDRLVVEPS